MLDVGRWMFASLSKEATGAAVVSVAVAVSE